MLLPVAAAVPAAPVPFVAVVVVFEQVEPVTANWYFQVPKPEPVTERPAMVSVLPGMQAGALKARLLYVFCELCVRLGLSDAMREHERWWIRPSAG